MIKPRPEINQFDGISLQVNEDIFRFDIPVNDTGIVTLNDRFHQLAEEGAGQFGCQATLFHELVEIHAALATLHDDDQCTARPKMIDDFDDPRDVSQTL